MLKQHGSPLIGLGIPALAIVVIMPLLANTSIEVLGIPLVYFWIFLWIPLTSLCLGIAWHFFDSVEPATEEGERR